MTDSNDDLPPDVPEHVRAGVRIARRAAEPGPRFALEIPPPPDDEPVLAAVEGKTQWISVRELNERRERDAFARRTRAAVTPAARDELAGRYRVLVGAHKGHVVELDGNEARVLLLASVVERVGGR